MTRMRRMEEWEKELDEELWEVVEEKTREVGDFDMWKLMKDSKTIEDAINTIRSRLHYLSRIKEKAIENKEIREKFEKKREEEVDQE